jgi:protein-tyrosine kinase
LLKVFAEHYDVIILNTSPILASSDAQIVAKKVGGVLISTLQNKTALKDAQEAYEECRSLGIDVQIALNAG